MASSCVNYIKPNDKTNENFAFVFAYVLGLQFKFFTNRLRQPYHLPTILKVVLAIFSISSSLNPYDLIFQNNDHKYCLL